MTLDEWDQWRELWLPEHGVGASPVDAAHVNALAARAERARRSLALVGVTELLLVIIAIAGLGAALRHAANAAEAILGASVALTIVVAWVVHTSARRRERSSAGASAAEYLSVLQQLRQRQIRFTSFVRVVLALELVFFVSWWIGGISVHRAAPAAPIAIVGFWLPLIAVVSLFAWTVRLRGVAFAELRRLTDLQRQLANE